MRGDTCDECDGKGRLAEPPTWNSVTCSQCGGKGTKEQSLSLPTHPWHELILEVDRFVEKNPGTVILASDYPDKHLLGLHADKDGGRYWGVSFLDMHDYGIPPKEVVGFHTALLRRSLAEALTDRCLADFIEAHLRKDT